MNNSEHELELTPSPADWQAIERLFDQQEIGATERAAELRKLRQICGRWLMLCRLSISLTRDQVAERVGVDAQLLALLELGLADAPLVSDEAWYRLSLVLEDPSHPYTRIAEAVQVALGQRADVAAEWVEELAAELAAGLDLAEAAPAPELVTDTQVLRAAGLALQESSGGKLKHHNFLVLHVLRQEQGRKKNAFDIKLAIERLARVSLNLADLPDLLGQLTQSSLVVRSEGNPPLYAITERGEKIAVSALKHAEYRQLVEKEKSARNTLDRLFNLLSAGGELP